MLAPAALCASKLVRDEPSLAFEPSSPGSQRPCQRDNVPGAYSNIWHTGELWCNACPTLGYPMCVWVCVCWPGGQWREFLRNGHINNQLRMCWERERDAGCVASSETCLRLHAYTGDSIVPSHIAQTQLFVYMTLRLVRQSGSHTRRARERESRWVLQWRVTMATASLWLVSANPSLSV